MEKISFFDKANRWLKNSITMRLLTIGILILLLLIPVDMIQSLIRERENRQYDANNEINQKWGNAQTFTGLVLTVPYNSYNKVYKADNEEYELVQNRQQAHFLPDEISIVGEVNPEIRYRGIYKVVVYKSSLQISGQFSKPSFEDWKIKDEDILWNEANISMGLTDLRGIQDMVELDWGEKKHSFNPGVETIDVMTYGISTKVDISDEDSYDFNLQVNFNGSSSLHFIPLGKTTNVDLKSSWSDPSFTGAFLPDSRTISKDGFQANWEVLHLNRSYPQKFRGPASGTTQAAFGVKLIVPVDEYQKSMRSAKYASLFIILTFLIFFFVQILRRVRIHPIQYIMVGLALCIFYVLLIALTEHIPFQLAYIIASLSTISMITLYAHTISKDIRVTRIIGLILLILYLFIYSIIQLQDYALLMGGIGLFIVMAIVMYLSRKINWFNVNAEE